MSNLSLPGTPGARQSHSRLSIPTAASVSSGHHHGGFVTGFIDHLASDIKDTVYGLPTGAIQLVTHPVKTVELTGKSMWQTWSPLFKGHPLQFAHNFYDHPLAPILDLATVVTLGAGAGVKGASLLGKAGVESEALMRIAKLGEARTVAVSDKLEHRPDVKYNFTDRPARRIVQEANWAAMQKLDQYLPQLVEKHATIGKGVEAVTNKVWGTQARFERLNRTSMIHRAAAKNLWVGMALQAGKALSDPATAPKMLREISIKQYMNFVKHAPRVKVDDTNVLRYGKDGQVTGLQSSHHMFVKDLRAESANAVKKIDEQIAKHQEALVKYQDQIDQGKLVARQLSVVRARRTRMLRENADPADIKELDKQLNSLQRQRLTAERQSVVFKQTQDKIKKAMKARELKVAERDQQIKSFFGAESESVNVGKLAQAKADGFEHDQAVRMATESGIGSPESFEKKVRDLGWAMTRHPEEALKDSNGDFLVVPRHDMKNLGQEAGESVNFLRWFWRKPSTAWKVAQVGYSPRTITQNMVGNYTIFALREDPLAAFAGLWHAVKNLKGDRDAAKLAAVGIGKNSKEWIYREFGDELGNVFGHEIDKGIGGLKESTKQRLKSGFYPIVHRTADEPVRLAGIMSYLAKDPAVKALMKKRGLSFERAAQIAMKRDRNLRDRAAEYTRTISGDYMTKGPIGRVLSDVVPFYLWDKHILKSTGNLVADTPGRAAILTRIGQEGTEETQKLLGLLPEFLRSAIPGQLLPGLAKPHGGRADIFQTAYLNPFATIGDLASAGQGFVQGGGVNPGSAIGQNLSPFLTGGAEFMFGRSLLTGQQVPRKEGLTHGLPGSVGSQIAQGLPMVRLLKQLTQPNYSTSPKTGKDLLFSHDRRSLLTSMLGFPVRNISQDRASELYDEEQKTLQQLAGTYQPKGRSNRLQLPPPPV